MDRPNALFVQGTLASGQVNSHVLAPPSQEPGRKHKSQALYMMPAGVPHTAVRARV